MAALDDGNNANNIGAQENEAVPLREYGNMQREQVVVVAASPDISIYNDTNKLRAATAQAVSELGDEYGALKDLTLPNGVPSGLWTITKPMGGGLLGAPGAQLFTIALNSLGARTGVVLDGDWAPAPVMGWLSEAAAAVNLYNVQNAGPVAHFVCFDPDISRFGKNCRDKSVIGAPVCWCTKSTSCAPSQKMAAQPVWASELSPICKGMRGGRSSDTGGTSGKSRGTSGVEPSGGYHDAVPRAASQ